jgi:hypothetical protein
MQAASFQPELDQLVPGGKAALKKSQDVFIEFMADDFESLRKGSTDDLLQSTTGYLLASVMGHLRSHSEVANDIVVDLIESFIKTQGVDDSDFELFDSVVD